MASSLDITDNHASTIYSIYSTIRSNLMKFTAALGFLLRYSGSIYLPAFKAVAADMMVGQELVAATVGVYLVANGFSFLIWGPASDRFGRLPVYGVACVGYIGSCLGCMFAPNITVLLVFRALQGGVVAAFSATALGVLADIVPPLARGKASGLNMIAVAIGVVVSPLIGGGFTQLLGWRSIFGALGIFCFVLGVALLLCFRHETHQYYVFQRLEKKDPAAARNMIEWEAVMANPPRLDAPWTPLMYMLEPAILPHALVCIVMWVPLTCVLMESLPTALAEYPYNLSPELVGVALLVDGFTTILACPLGGLLSDKAAARMPNLPVARMAPNTLILLILGPAAAVGVGWGMQHGVHLAVLIAAAGIVSFSGCCYVPALLSYITTVKQSAPASATCGIFCIINIVSGVVVFAGAIVRQGLGYGWWLTCLGLIQFVVTGMVYAGILRQQNAYRTAAQDTAACIVTVQVGGGALAKTATDLEKAP